MLPILSLSYIHTHTHTHTPEAAAASLHPSVSLAHARIQEREKRNEIPLLRLRRSVGRVEGPGRFLQRRRRSKRRDPVRPVHFWSGEGREFFAKGKREREERARSWDLQKRKSGEKEREKGP